VFTGTLRGYGNTVILEHGDGLRSLYAHNREITVAEGDAVEQGATIARWEVRKRHHRPLSLRGSVG
jgi:murein DD-endopeptidase MepM/ murein hydrolase activator NlpD